MKVVVINGPAQAGKDCFCQLCKDSFEDKIYSISSVDLVKTAAKILGWNKEKTDINRKALSDLKDLADKYFDSSYNYIKNMIEYYEDIIPDGVLFIHIREPEQIERITNDFNGYSLLIKNDRVNLVLTNHADREVYNYKYDYIIENNGTIEDLKQKAIEFIKGFE